MLNHGLHPRSPLSVPWTFKSPVAQAWQGQIRDNLTAAKKALDAAQQRSKAYADKHRREVTLTVGYVVLLNSKNLNQDASVWDAQADATVRWAL